MRVNVLPNTLIFEGILNEDSSLAELNSAFEKLKSNGAKAPVILDFSKVTRANSSGILTWLKFLKNSGFQFKYVNTPVWLVTQFNLIDGYFDHNSYVESFQAPFFSPKTQASKNFTLKLGTEVGIQPEYTDLNLPRRVVNGEEFEMDFDPQEYFHFIARNFESFKNNISKV